MLIAVERLLIKLRQPASRAAELNELRRRTRAERATAPDDEERALAREVHEHKLQVARTVGAVDSCGSCASGQPWPVGHHRGGACCSGVTAELFDDDELAALVLAGTHARDLVAPSRDDDHAGCAFRGATGCSLELAHRPARCVHYACTTLRRELHRRGLLDETEAQLAALDRAMQAFRVVHRARRDREVLAPLIEALSRR